MTDFSAASLASAFAISALMASRSVFFFFSSVEKRSSSASAKAMIFLRSASVSAEESSPSFARFTLSSIVSISELSFSSSAFSESRFPSYKPLSKAIPAAYCLILFAASSYSLPRRADSVFKLSCNCQNPWVRKMRWKIFLRSDVGAKRSFKNSPCAIIDIWEN